MRLHLLTRETLMNTAARTRIYLKKTCPYCLKLRIFLTEAGIAGDFDFIVFADGDETHQAARARMQAAGQEPSFPAAEIGGALVTGTDDLIARFAGSAGVDPATLPLLNYYSEGVFRRHVEMHRELRELKKGQ
jgi:glutaredoxin